MPLFKFIKYTLSELALFTCVEVLGRAIVSHAAGKDEAFLTLIIIEL